MCTFLLLNRINYERLVRCGVECSTDFFCVPNSAALINGSLFVRLPLLFSPSLLPFFSFFFFFLLFRLTGDSGDCIASDKIGTVQWERPVRAVPYVQDDNCASNWEVEGKERTGKLKRQSRLNTTPLYARGNLNNDSEMKYFSFLPYSPFPDSIVILLIVGILQPL